MRKRSIQKSAPAGTVAEKREHYVQIDILKGLAIISVILMHTYSQKILTAFGAPFSLFQAVPVFLLLAAFNNAAALASLKRSTLAGCYDPSILIRRLKRLIVSYAAIWIVQLVLVFWLLASAINTQVQNPNHFFYRGFDTVLNFLFGANGPGNYFIPLIVQFILIVPFFYFLAVRYSPDLMLAAAFVLDMILEYLSVVLGVPEWLYAVSITRYTFMAGLGVWLVFQERVVNLWMVAAALLSAAYIAAVSYFGFQPWFFRLDPSFYHAFAYFWTLLLVVLGFQYLPSRITGRITGAVAELGRASWHIFLVQMTFFFFLGYAFNPLEQSVAIVVLLAFFYLIPCIAIGYGFYLLQNRLMSPGKAPSC